MSDVPNSELDKQIKKAISGVASGGMKAKTLLASLEAMVGGSFDNMDTKVKIADKEMRDAYQYLLDIKGEYWANRYRKISTLGAKRDFLNGLGITRDMVKQYDTNR